MNDYLKDSEEFFRFTYMEKADILMGKLDFKKLDEIK